MPPGLGPDELAAFGLFNQFHYHAVLMQPDMPTAMNTNMTLNPYYTIIGQKIADGGVFTSANRPA